jgi:hypothetical protein
MSARTAGGAPLAGCGGDAGASRASAAGGGADASRPAPAPVAGPTLVAVGDIACPPGQPRTRFACNQGETAALIAQQHPDVVAALGDLQYPDGSLAAFRGSFERSWGRFAGRLRPALGNHEYETPSSAAASCASRSRARRTGH